jgi:hypothetical protein
MRSRVPAMRDLRFATNAIVSWSAWRTTPSLGDEAMVPGPAAAGRRLPACLDWGWIRGSWGASWIWCEGCLSRVVARRGRWGGAASALAAGGAVWAVWLGGGSACPGCSASWTWSRRRGTTARKRRLLCTDQGRGKRRVRCAGGGVQRHVGRAFSSTRRAVARAGAAQRGDPPHWPDVRVKPRSARASRARAEDGGGCGAGERWTDQRPTKRP